MADKDTKDQAPADARAADKRADARADAPQNPPTETRAERAAHGEMPMPGTQGAVGGGGRISQDDAPEKVNEALGLPPPPANSEAGGSGPLAVNSTPSNDEDVNPQIAASRGTMAGDVPVPGALFAAPSTYIVGQRDIRASSVGEVAESNTMRALSVTADANGDKIVFEGTVLQQHDPSLKMEPRVDENNAYGILLRRVNLRDGDVDVAVLRAGHVRSDKCWDDGTFGTMDATYTVTPLAAKGLFFHDHDV